MYCIIKGQMYKIGSHQVVNGLAEFDAALKREELQFGKPHLLLGARFDAIWKNGAISNLTISAITTDVGNVPDGVYTAYLTAVDKNDQESIVSNLSGEATANGTHKQISVTWTEIENVKGYNLYMQKDGSGGYWKQNGSTLITESPYTYNQNFVSTGVTLPTSTFEPLSYDKFAEGSIAFESPGFPHPEKVGSPALGWFMACSGKQIKPSVPLFIENQLRILSKNTLEPLSSPAMSVPLEIVELVPVESTKVHEEEVFYTDEFEFLVENRYQRARLMGSTLEEIRLTDGVAQTIYLSDRFKFATIEQVSVIQYCQNTTIGTESDKDATGVYVKLNKQPIPKDRTDFRPWNDIKIPVGNAPTESISLAPDDFHGSVLGGGKYGGVFGPSAGDFAEDPDYVQFNDIQADFPLPKMPILCGQKLEIGLKNVEGSSNLAETHVLIEIAYYELM